MRSTEASTGVYHEPMVSHAEVSHAEVPHAEVGDGQLIPTDTQAAVVFVFYVGLAGSVSFCGCVANVINVGVFSRQNLQVGQASL